MSEEELKRYKEWIDDDEEIVVDSSIFEPFVNEIERLNEEIKNLKSKYVYVPKIDYSKEVLELRGKIYNIRKYINNISPSRNYAESNEIGLIIKELLEILDKGSDKE